MSKTIQVGHCNVKKLCEEDEEENFAPEFDDNKIVLCEERKARKTFFCVL